jgi:hypothetical protein
MTKQNSNYENHKAQIETEGAYTFLAFLITFAGMFILAYLFNDFFSSVPFWSLLIFNLVFPFWLGSRIFKWAVKSGIPIQGKDD